MEGFARRSKVEVAGLQPERRLDGLGVKRFGVVQVNAVSTNESLNVQDLRAQRNVDAVGIDGEIGGAYGLPVAGGGPNAPVEGADNFGVSEWHGGWVWASGGRLD